MAGSLIDRFLSRSIHKGRLELTHADGTGAAFGQPGPGFPNVSIRFADNRVAPGHVLG